MIIQRPDGSYELCCPLPPLLVVWLRGLARSGRAALAAAWRGGLWRAPSAGACPQCDGSPCA